jgi:PKD repeat protein
LSNPDIANPVALPDVTTTYYLTARSNGGGCLTSDSVVVKRLWLDNAIQLLGKAAYCIGSGDSSVLIRAACRQYSMVYRNNVAIPGANSTRYKVTQSGAYHALLFGGYGCMLTTVVQQIDIATVPVADFSLSKPNQCLFGNQFILKNNSTNAIGAIEYKWTFGDGTEATTRDVTYSYKKAGKFRITMVASSIGDLCRQFHF